MVKTAENGIKKKLQLLTLFFLGLLLPFGLTSTTQALSGSDFKAGDIIADTVFFNRDSMSQAQIQDFLNAKVPNCDTNGTEMHSSGQTRAQYGASKGYPAPYTCLKSYSQSIPSTPKDASGYCEAIGGGTKNASQIIYDVSRACYINPQTLLVLLQKEQSLITDEWPWSSQYRSATGYGCPDTAPCDSQYYGFFNQVYQAAKAYKRYAANPANYNYRAGRNNNVLYNPNSSCGSSTVYINNQATAGLYVYTPYQPNAAALNNLYGSGDGCSAYGNRNFWRMFNDWFGNTSQPYPKLETQRWMQVSGDTHKRNVYSGTNVDAVNNGTQLFFVDKIHINGTWYLRTSFDSGSKYGKGIPLDELSEIPYTAFEEPRHMILNVDTHKLNPRTGAEDKSGYFSKSTSMKFTRKIWVNGEWFYQTEFDENNGHDRAIAASKVSDITFTSLESPRYMIIKNGTKRMDLRSNNTISTYTADTKAMIADKTLVNGQWYFRSAADNGTNYAVLANNVHEEVSLDEFAGIAYMTVKLKHNSSKYDVERAVPLEDQSLKNDQTVRVARKLKTNNGLIYYQTSYDASNDNLRGILVTDVEVITPQFVPLENPRNITLSQDSTKINLMTGELIGSDLSSGTSLKYQTKVLIGDKWYLRSEFDTQNRQAYVIPIEHLNI